MGLDYAGTDSDGLTLVHLVVVGLQRSLLCPGLSVRDGRLAQGLNQINPYI